MRTLIGGLLIATGLASPSPGQGRLSVDSVIAWLPPNTETLIVAKGPLDVRDTSDHGPVRVASALTKMAAVGLSLSRTQNVVEALRSAHLRFAVEGARHFDPPRGLGLAPYDGCHIAVFESVDAPALDEFLRAVKAASDGAVEVATLNALRLDWRAEQDNWSAFVVRPRSNVIIICRSEAILAEVLERAMHGGPGRAFPTTFQEWTAVDTTARVWALRHYAQTRSNRDLTSPLTNRDRAGNAIDSLAIGMTVSISADTGGIIARYLSGNQQAESISRRIWAQVPGPSFSTDSLGVRITIASTIPESRGTVLLIVLAVLGHPIFI